MKLYYVDGPKAGEVEDSTPSVISTEVQSLDLTLRYVPVRAMGQNGQKIAFMLLDQDSKALELGLKREGRQLDWPDHSSNLRWILGYLSDRPV